MKDTKKIFAVASMFTLAVFISGGSAFTGKVHAQTTPATTNQQGQSEFKHDVEKGVQEVSGDTDAQNNQLEINNEDNESAGDEHADVKEVDGENNQSEIDNEIEQEVDQEDATSGQSSDQGNGSVSSSTENGSSSGVDTGN